MTFDTDGTSHRSGSHTIHATASRSSGFALARGDNDAVGA